MSSIRNLMLSLLFLALTPALRGADGSSQSAIAALAAQIDQRIAAAWDKEVKPAPLARDAEFFRRVHLDLAGRIPSITEIRDFLDDDRPDKRAGLLKDRKGRRILVERFGARKPKAEPASKTPARSGPRKRRTSDRASGPRPSRPRPRDDRDR